MKKKYSATVPFLIKYGHHIIFTTAILLMTSLLIWWSVFISNSIDDQYKLQMSLLEKTLKYEALKGDRQIHDNRLEYTDSPDQVSERLPDSFITQSSDKRYLRIKPSAIKEIEANLRSKRVMVTGESIFLFAMLIICCTLLYKFITLNRKINRETENFWRTITHEIKTPIAGIKIFLQSLQKGAFKKEDMARYLRLAIEQVNRQEKMAENLIAGASMGTGKKFFPFEEFDLVQFTENYITNYRKHSSNIDIIINLPQEEVMLYCSPDAVRLILNNLMDNFRKYCTDDPLIIFKIENNRKTASLIIEDNGPGLPQNIIERYKRRNESVFSSSGAGIGLQISSELAQRNKGSLVISNSSQGAVFKLSLRK